MGHDEIIQEVRAVREGLAARHNYSVRALFEQAKRQEREGGRKVVHLEPKRVPRARKKSA